MHVMAKQLLLICLVLPLTGTLCSPLHFSESAPPAQREKRSYTPAPDYPLTVYSHLADDYGGQGEWKKLNCNVIYNCEKVSSHHCTQKGSRFFCSNNKGRCIDKDGHLSNAFISGDIHYDNNRCLIIHYSERSVCYRL